MDLTIEEALRKIEDGLALLSLLSESQTPLEPRVMSGLGNSLDDLQQLAYRIRRSLNTAALCTDLVKARSPR
jgi:hypothetical protein